MKSKLMLLCLVLVLLLCACGQTAEAPSNTRSMTVNGTAYTVDDAAGTISDGANVYAFSVEYRASGSRVSFTYPDGSSWWHETKTNTEVGGWSDSYAPEEHGYAEGEVLYGVLTSDSPETREKSGPNPLLALLLLAVGAWGTASPRSMWFVEHGWRYKDAEPSEMALGANRVTGIVCLLIGVVMLISIVF